MRIYILKSSIIALALLWGFFSSQTYAATTPTKLRVVQAPISTAQQRAVEEVNSLIIDSYKSRLDSVLAELYINIESASKGDTKLMTRALTRVRDDLDNRLDLLADSNISSNRRKILTGVYFYLKSNIEEKTREINEMK